MKKRTYKYSIEMFRDGDWEVEVRYYEKQKNLNDFDLYSIDNKRRNAQFIEVF